MRRPDRVLQGLIRHRFLVTMVDEQTWDGVVMEADELSVVLRDADLLTHENGAVNKVHADGEVILPRRRIAYMQWSVDRPGEA